MEYWKVDYRACQKVWHPEGGSLEYGPWTVEIVEVNAAPARAERPGDQTCAPNDCPIGSTQSTTGWAGESVNTFTGNYCAVSYPGPVPSQNSEWENNDTTGNTVPGEWYGRGYDNDTPTVGIVSPYYAIAGESTAFATFFLDSDGYLANVLWDFGAGLPTDVENPTFTYEEEDMGWQRITLVAWDDYGRGVLDETMINVTPSIPGDADLDGDVDADDVAILADNWNTSSGMDWEDADFNWDGAVDSADYTILALYYGSGTGGGGSPVPEPGIVSLLSLAAVALVLRRRGRAMKR
jgi:hypothetical protein